MSDSSQYELLSAYLDGEASPEERAVVEELLRTSLEARSELAELEKLSGLLKDLPTQPAPASVAAAARVYAERRSLLGVDLQSSHTPQIGLSRRRRWIGGATSLLATVALFTVAVTYWNRSPSDDVGAPSAMLMSDNAATGEGGAGGTAAAGSLELQQQDTLEFQRQDVRHQANRTELAASKSGQPSGRSEARKRIAAETEDLAAIQAIPQPTAPSVAMLKSTPSAAGEAALFDSQMRRGATLGSRNLDHIRIGDAIPYFEVTDDKIAVVEVTVIDVRRALGAIQLLLVKNDIPNQPEGSLADVLKSALPADKANDDMFFGIYVEASSDQLSQAFAGLSDQQELLGLRLRPPVELTRLGMADDETAAAADASRNLAEQSGKEKTEVPKKDDKGSSGSERDRYLLAEKSRQPSDADVNAAVDTTPLQRVITLPTTVFSMRNGVAEAEGAGGKPTAAAAAKSSPEGEANPPQPTGKPAPVVGGPDGPPPADAKQAAAALQAAIPIRRGPLSPDRVRMIFLLQERRDAVLRNGVVPAEPDVPARANKPKSAQ